VEITEVRIKLMTRRNDKLRAFCSITLDDSFVIRDIKIIEGARGAFVAMPSRKLTDRCPRCGMKNHLRSKFCSECGSRLSPDRAVRDPQGRARLHADIAHPIHAAARDLMQKRILQAYDEEVEKSKLPGYKPVEIFESPDDYETDNDL
jgi:stage V sporulation protein G